MWCALFRNFLTVSTSLKSDFARPTLANCPLADSLILDKHRVRKERLSSCLKILSS